MPTTLAKLGLGAVARRRAAFLLGLAVGLATTPRAAAQSPDDPAQIDPVVVTVTRMEQKAGDAPASVTVLTRDDIHYSGTQTVDDLLRQVPGFILFRRSSSLVTHPTTQGVSLRGIGPSGTSRALVLFDGVPANDAFGGWVYCSRVPMLGVEQIEVIRGGGSSVWGNYALGGVVQVLSRRPTERGLFFDASYGTPLQFNHTGTGGGAIGGRLGTPDNGELRFAAYARRKRLTSREPSTRLAPRGSVWSSVQTLRLSQWR